MALVKFFDKEKHPYIYLDRAEAKCFREVKFPVLKKFSFSEGIEEDEIQVETCTCIPTGRFIPGYGFEYKWDGAYREL